MLAGCLFLLTACDEQASGPPAPTGEPRAERQDQWRTEHWHDVQVDVPADWGYGGAPIGDRTGRYACWPEAMVSAAGQDLRNGEGKPYVGRPIALTDLCVPYPFEGSQPGLPDAPYVWLGADVEPGSVELGEGWVQETREVNGSTVTVATDDLALRHRILGSATGGERCLSELEGGVRRDPDPAGDDPTVCAYAWADGLQQLTYATVLGDADAEAFLNAFAAAPAFEPGGLECDVRLVDSDKVLLVIGGDEYDVLLDAIGCPRVVGPDRTVELTADLVLPWVGNGIPAVVHGPTGGKGAMIDSFIGPLG
jgi:hypothetical protein